LALFPYTTLFLSDRLVFALESRAQMEHVLGALLQSKGDTAGAREAYGRALTEDLTYYPAHVALGTLAYSVGDTATAMHELREAAQLAGGEPTVRYTLGLVLATSGHVAEGVEELFQAIKLAPHWAEPHFLLARLHEASEMNDEAVMHWKNFLARAPQTHGAWQHATDKVAQATASK
jgi:Tfp pilus assembly protein PilF